MKDSKNALIIVDMQEAYFKDEKLNKQRANLIEAINRQIDASIEKNELIVNARTVHSHDKSSWTLNMLEDDQGFLLEESNELAIPLTLPSDAVTINKTRDNAFHETELIEILRENDITHVTLAGISAHNCIFHTAAAAYAYNLRVTLLREAIGDEDEEAMTSAFEYLEKEYRQSIR